MQREEEMMEAGLAEMNRVKTRDLVQEKDREFKWEEWDWESAIEEDGSTREAFEPRGSKGHECQKDGEEKTVKGGKDGDEKTGKGGRDERDKNEKTEKGGRDERETGGKEVHGEGRKERHEESGKERQEEGGKEGQDKGEEGKEACRWQDDRQNEGGNEVIRRQDDGQDEGGNKGFRWQDDDDEDDKKQVEKQGNVVKRQFEGDMRQEEDGRGRATDVWKKDEGEKRRESWEKVDNE